MTIQPAFGIAQEQCRSAAFPFDYLMNAGDSRTRYSRNDGRETEPRPI